MVGSRFFDYLFASSAATATAALYVLFSLTITIFLSLKVPAFQTPDAQDHLYRAETVSDGVLVARRIEHDGNMLFGGIVSRSIDRAMGVVNEIPFHYEQKFERGMQSRLKETYWNEEKAASDFRNTAANPPFLYFPQAAALATGKLLGLTVERTVHLMRLVNAICCIIVASIAVLIAGKANLFLFVILSFPMVSSLYSSMSPDGLMIAIAALSAACIMRPFNDGRRRMAVAEFLVCLVCLSIVAMARPTYALLPLVILALPALDFPSRFLGFLVSSVVSLGWTLPMILVVGEPVVHPSGWADQGAQLDHLFANPLAIFTIAEQTLARFGSGYFDQIVGILGWLDTPLPRLYVSMALVFAGFGILHDVSLRKAGGSWTLSSTGALVLLLSSGSIFAALYLAWTPVGADHVIGVQGRYFLPLLVFLPVMVSAIRTQIDGGPFEPILSGVRWVAVVVFPIVSIAVTQAAVIERYYQD